MNNNFKLKVIIFYNIFLNNHQKLLYIFIDFIKNKFLFCKYFKSMWVNQANFFKFSNGL